MYPFWTHRPPLSLHDPYFSLIEADKTINVVHHQNLVLNRQLDSMIRQNVDLRTRIKLMNAEGSLKKDEIKNIGYSKDAQTNKRQVVQQEENKKKYKYQTETINPENSFRSRSRTNEKNTIQKRAISSNNLSPTRRGADTESKKEIRAKINQEYEELRRRRLESLSPLRKQDDKQQKNRKELERWRQEQQRKEKQRKKQQEAIRREAEKELQKYRLQKQEMQRDSKMRAREANEPYTIIENLKQSEDFRNGQNRRQNQKTILRIQSEVYNQPMSPQRNNQSSPTKKDNRVYLYPYNEQREKSPISKLKSIKRETNNEPTPNRQRQSVKQSVQNLKRDKQYLNLVRNLVDKNNVEDRNSKMYRTSNS